jgi:hypothetical protein
MPVLDRCDTDPARTERSGACTARLRRPVLSGLDSDALAQFPMTASVLGKNQDRGSGWYRAFPKQMAAPECQGKTARARNCPVDHAPRCAPKRESPMPN